MFAAVLYASALTTAKTTALVFKIETPKVSSSVLAETAGVMRDRLKAAGMAANVRVLGGARVQVTIHGAAPSSLPRLLTETGDVTFRIVQNGDVYRAPAGRAIRDARAEYDMMGQPIVIFHTTDPHSFYRFTRAHVNKDMGIYLDGRLLTRASIMLPISDTGEIVGNGTLKDAQVTAAIIGSGPLPAPVRLVSKST